MARTGTTPDGKLWAFDERTGNWNEIDSDTYLKLREQGDIGRRVQAGRMAAEDVGPLDAMGLAAGKSFEDIGTGIQDLYYRATGQEEERQALEQEQRAKETAFDAVVRKHPFLAGIGASAPYMVGGGLAGVGRGLGTALLRQGAMAGGIGAAQYAPTLGERAGRAAGEAVMAGVGEGIGRGLGRMITPGMMPRQDVTQGLIQEAEKAGFNVTPASLVESNRFRNVVEGSLETMPTSAPVMDAARAVNEERLQELAAQSIGQGQSRTVNDLVLANAHRELGDVFQSIAGRNTTYNLDETVLDELQRMEQERIFPYLRGAEDPVRNLIDTTLDLMTKRPAGKVTGRELHTNITLLGNHARSAIRTNPELGLALFDMQGILLDVFNRQLSRPDAQRFRQARQQWRNLVNLETAIHPETGRIMPATLANTLSRRDRGGYMLGGNRDPYYTGVRFMARVQPELRTSGTAERSALQNLIASGVHLGPGATGLAATDPTATAAGFLAPFVLPYLGARAYTAPAARNLFLRQPWQGPGFQQMPQPVQNLMANRFVPAFARIPIPGTQPFRMTQQGMLGLGGIGLTHGLVGLQQD